MIKIDVGFKIRKADPCLLYRENKHGIICMIIIYVDVMMVIGHKESIIDVQERVKNNRNMSKSKGWTLQSSLLMLWMDENSNQQSNKNC